MSPGHDGEELIRRFASVPLEKWVRADFYPLLREFVDFARNHGMAAANRMAADFVNTIITAELWERLLSDREETFQILAKIAGREPQSFLDAGISDLIAGRPSSAIIKYGRIHKERIDNFEKYKSILLKGADRSLAVWQVMNPFYLLWVSLPVARGKTSNLWRSDQFNSAIDAQIVINSKVTPNEKRLSTFIKRHIGSTLNQSTKVFEFGTGHGRNALLLIRDLGLNPDSYQGIDLHPERCAVTADVLHLLSENKSPIRNAKDKVFPLDVLSDRAIDAIQSGGPVDIVFYASFNCAFDDCEFSKFLSLVKSLDPIFIVDVSATTSWGLSVGRIDPTDFYESVGYGLQASEFEQPALCAGDAHKLWMPNKYWSNRRILLYRRQH